MYLSKLTIENYRCFPSVTLNFNKRLTVLVGENNIGKSNVLSALSLIFSQDVSQSSRQLEKDDIWNGWRSLPTLPTVRIVVDFEGFDPIPATITDDAEREKLETKRIKELALVSKWLVVSRDKLKARVTYEFRPKYSMNGPFAQDFVLPLEDYEWTIFGGEVERDNIDYRDLSQIRLELLHALRDAERELSGGNRKRFGRLISRFKPDNFDEPEHEGRKQISEATKALNDLLEDTEPLKLAQSDINSRLIEVSGRNNYQETKLIGSAIEYDDLVKNLRVQVKGINQENYHAVELNGLGYNNLLYVSALLADFYKRRQLSGASGLTHPIVAIEEPEAHLHPHLQKFLSHYFATNNDGQVIVTSHSTHVTSSISPEHLLILYRDINDEIRATTVQDLFDSRAESRRNLNMLKRHLDATKSTFLFARSVIMVEGLSEALLLPVIASRCYGIDLDDSGVSVLSVHGTSFKPFLQLFGEKAIRKRCVILHDADPPLNKLLAAHGDAGPIDMKAHSKLDYDPAIDCFPLAVGDSDYLPSEGALSLKTESEKTEVEGEVSKYVSVQLNLKTLEHDIVIANFQHNRKSIERALDLSVGISTKITQPNVDIAKRRTTPKGFSKAVLFAVSDGKGAFAQALAEVILEGYDFTVPSYIEQAFRFLQAIEEVEE